MAENLEQRAETQLELLRTWNERIATALTDARAELHRRHPDPSSVDPDNWATQLGAIQHVATARAALSVLRADQDRIRTRLAAVSNPADTDTYEAELRASLITDATLRVQLRLAEERTAAAETTTARLSELIERARAAVAAAETELKTAARRQADATALRAALTEAPLNTLVTDATQLGTSATWSAAEVRLTALVPDPLRSRALARADEANDADTAAAAHWKTGQSHEDQVHTVDAPVNTAVAAAERDFARAETELRRYVYTAHADLVAAEAALVAVAGLPDLTAAQQAALDPAARADAVAAAQAEQTLATAVATLNAAERAVQDAIVAALAADPDTDPEQDPDVIAAKDARDDPAIQNPLVTARGAYDDAARAALDAWEVEVPPRLWQALVAFATAWRTLDRLADQTVRDALVTDLNAAQDALAGALTDRDVHLRRELAVALALVPRAGAAAAASIAPADRTSQYVRGDGPGGRTPGQL